MSQHTPPARAVRTALLLPLLALGACTTTSAGEDAPEAPVDGTGQVATAAEAVTHEQNDRVPRGASWTQHYFPSAEAADGSEAELHADVLLPEDLPAGEQVPVILSVGAYFGHSGEVSLEGQEHTGPSARFEDLVEGGDLFAQGYALVQVDLRGFGGSSGCLDFMGAGEQADVAAAVDWAASQPWSSGAVGMYGKSYDAITGLVGNNLDQDALQAVVAQEPIWDLQRNIWSNGVPRTTVVDVARTYNEVAALPPHADDDERYQTNAAYESEHPECAVVNSAGYQSTDPESGYWPTRDLARQAEGTDTPLMVTQGFLEWNTEPEAMEELLANHEGLQRGWLGQWDHVRGNEVAEDGRLAMGREGWFEEVVSFYDEHLKGVEPSVDYPAYAVQDSTGGWRAEESWPTTDDTVQLGLQGGSYLDDGAEGDPEVDTGNSFTQTSEPLAQATRLTGTPRVALDVEGVGNVHVRLHDVAPDGSAVLFDEQVSVVSVGEMAFDLKSTDWTLAEGHALGVEIGTVQAGALSDWIDSPSGQDVEVSEVELELALDDPSEDLPTEGEPAVYLETYRGLATSQLPAGPPTFTVPAPRG